MKRHVFWAFIAALLFSIAPQQARAACDYDIGGAAPYTFSEFEIDMDEELACLEIGVFVQAYDADLDTWAGTTPATGVATALATPSSSNLRSAVTDEVGTGALMFGLAAGMADDLSCTASQVVRRNAGDTAFECATFAGGGDALVANSLAQFAATTSLELLGVISNETGSGALVFATSPTLVTPNLGTPSAATLTNASGLPLSTGITDDASCAALEVVRRNAGDTAWECVAAAGGGDAQTADPLSQFAATTSAELRGVMSDETGAGNLMFGVTTDMTDGLTCSASQVIRRNAGDTAFECATLSGAPTIDTQTMTSTGSGDSWDKPSGGQQYCHVQLWGAGGSGGKGASGSAAGGGGGGAWVEKHFLISALSSTEQVTVGAGGASQTTASTDGNAGGNTTFGVSGTLVTAYGGGAGSGDAASANGGGAGGGAVTAPGAPSGVTAVNTSAPDMWAGYGGAPITTGAAAVAGQPTFGGGAGGGGASGAATFANGAGGDSFNGGAGGGAGAEDSAPGAGAGGDSKNGGDGGAGGFDANNATAGSQPAGGGGGSEEGNSGAGGDGKAVITCW